MSQYFRNVPARADSVTHPYPPASGVAEPGVYNAGDACSGEVPCDRSLATGGADGGRNEISTFVEVVDEDAAALEVSADIEVCFVEAGSAPVTVDYEVFLQPVTGLSTEPRISLGTTSVTVDSGAGPLDCNVHSTRFEAVYLGPIPEGSIFHVIVARTGSTPGVVAGIDNLLLTTPDTYCDGIDGDVQALIDDVLALGLRHGIENALTVKLESALRTLEDSNTHNDCAAANKVGAFINQVEAQADKTILGDDASALIHTAEAIIEALRACVGCGL